MKKRILAILSAVVIMTLSSVTFAYGDPMWLRGEDILIDIPDSWNTEELSNSNAGFENIFQAGNEAGTKSLDIVYYANEESLGYDYLYYKDEAQDFYEGQGQIVLEDYLADYLDSQLWETHKIKYFESNGYRAYVRVTMDIDGVNHYIYMTAAGETVYQILDFTMERSEKNLKQAGEIMDSFYDYGYYNSLLEGGGFFSGGDGDSTGFVALPGVLIVLLVLVMKSLAGRKRSSSKFHGYAREKKEKPLTVSLPKKEAPAVKVNKTPTDEAVEFKAGCTYEDSLKTLLKSGLLTRKEYQEMVDKYHTRGY